MLFSNLFKTSNIWLLKQNLIIIIMYKFLFSFQKYYLKKTDFLTFNL